MADDLESDIAQLKDRRSPRRRSAAKRLRKRGDPAAGDALLAALRLELEDPRTWETQYQLVLALAACRCAKAVPLLTELAGHPFEATMVLMGVGDSLVRLRSRSLEDAEPVIDLIGPDRTRPDQTAEGAASLACGALRAMAYLRLVPPADQRQTILECVGRLPLDDPQRLWTAAAAAGWGGEPTRAFLEGCCRSSRDDVRETAELSLQGKYRRWSPL